MRGNFRQGGEGFRLLGAVERREAENQQLSNADVATQRI